MMQDNAFKKLKRKISLLMQCYSGKIELEMFSQAYMKRYMSYLKPEDYYFNDIIELLTACHDIVLVENHDSGKVLITSKSCNDSSENVDTSSVIPAHIVTAIREILEARGGALSLDDIDYEYEIHTSTSLDFKSLGFKSVLDLVSSLKSFYIIESRDHQHFLSLTPQQHRHHVSSTDSSSSSVQSSKTQEFSRTLPLTAQSNLRELLTLHYPHGLYIEELYAAYKAFYGIHNEDLNYEKYGFLSMQLLLKAHSEICSLCYANGKITVLALASVFCPDVNTAAEDVQENDYLLRSDQYPRLGIADLFEVGQSRNVRLSDVYDPHKFYVVINGKDHYSALENLLDRMMVFYDSPLGSRYHLTPEHAVPKSPVVIVNPKEKEYCRGLVTHIIDLNHVKVFDVDHGAICTYPVTSLRLLHKHFATLPAQAILAKLGGIKKPHDCHKWPEATSIELLSLAKNEVISATVSKIEEQKLTFSKLCVKKHTKKEVEICAALVAKNLAIRKSGNDEGDVIATSGQCQLNCAHSPEPESLLSKGVSLLEDCSVFHGDADGQKCEVLCSSSDYYDVSLYERQSTLSLIPLRCSGMDSFKGSVPLRDLSKKGKGVLTRKPHISYEVASTIVPDIRYTISNAPTDSGASPVLPSQPESEMYISDSDESFLFDHLNDWCERRMLSCSTYINIIILANVPHVTSWEISQFIWDDDQLLQVVMKDNLSFKPTFITLDSHSELIAKFLSINENCPLFQNDALILFKLADVPKILRHFSFQKDSIYSALDALLLEFTSPKTVKYEEALFLPNGNPELPCIADSSKKCHSFSSGGTDDAQRKVSSVSSTESALLGTAAAAASSFTESKLLSSVALNPGEISAHDLVRELRQNKCSPVKVKMAIETKEIALKFFKEKLDIMPEDKSEIVAKIKSHTKDINELKSALQDHSSKEKTCSLTVSASEPSTLEKFMQSCRSTPNMTIAGMQGHSSHIPPAFQGYTFPNTPQINQYSSYPYVSQDIFSSPTPEYIQPQYGSLTQGRQYAWHPQPSSFPPGFHQPPTTPPGFHQPPSFPPGFHSTWSQPFNPCQPNTNFTQQAYYYYFNPRDCNYGSTPHQQH